MKMKFGKPLFSRVFVVFIIVFLGGLYSGVCFSEVDFIEFYGELSGSFQKRNTNPVFREERWVNHASRLGLQGEFSNHKIRSFYVVEYGLDLDSQKIKTFPLRDLYIGVGTDSASLLVGRMNTPLKISQYKVDVFNDVLDMRSLITSDRNGNMVTVFTRFYGFEFRLASTTSDKAYVEGGLGEGWSSSLSWRRNGLYLGIAIDKKIALIDSQRLVFHHSGNRFSWGGLIQRSKTLHGSKAEEWGGLLSMTYEVREGLIYKVQMVRSNMETGVPGFYGVRGAGAHMISMGLDKEVFDNFTVFGYLGKARDHKNRDAQVFGLGFRYVL